MMTTNANGNCNHDDRSAEGTNWICDHCGEAEAMTAEDIDWCREDSTKCRLCNHSEDFGGPIEQRTSWLGKTFPAHITPCR